MSCVRINVIRLGMLDLVISLSLDSFRNELVYVEKVSGGFLDLEHLRALKNELRKLKGKNIVDTAVSTPTATTIAPGMFKINLEPLAPKLLKNIDVHMDYIKHSRDHADILQEIVENARALCPLDSNLDSAFTTWEDLVEKFIQKFHQLSYNDDEMEAKEDDNPNDVAENFKIKGNLFDFETPLCKASNEFNYLLKIDIYLFTFDIHEIKTYEEYEYELNNNIMGDLEEPWWDNGVPYQLCDHICEPYRFKNGKDQKWYDELTDGVLKDEALMHKARNYGSNNAGDTQDKHKKKHERNEHTLFSNPIHDPSVCQIRRFKMIKYSFDTDDEYVVVKEHEYFDHSRTNIDACQDYRELFRIMDEGWLVTKAKEE
ncbi:hypothetical protein Tco_1134276 [Tanacetum coccineum]